MNISEPIPKQKENHSLFTHAVWELPFRSFFLAAAMFSVISMSLWLMTLLGAEVLNHTLMSSVLWHSYEMIFGFAVLVAVGFILTAVQTWTGRASIKGLPVALLLCLWLVIRVLMYINNTYSILLAIALQAVWWLTVVSVFFDLVYSSKNKRNYLFIPLLIMLASFNLIILATIFLEYQQVATHFIQTSVLLFTLLMAIVGGRVIPFFTVRGANTAVKEPIAWVEKILLPVSITGIALYLLSKFVDIPISPALFMIIAGMLHLIRMTRWSSFHTSNVPLLWSLHFSYFFMGAGLICLGASYFVSWLTFSSALHVILEDYNDAPLQIGSSWTDPSNSFKITPVAKGGTENTANAWIDVEVVKY